MAQYYNHMNIIDLFRFDHIVTVHFCTRCSILGLMKENPAKALWSMESIRDFSQCERRGFSLKTPGQVTAVIWSFLQKKKKKKRENRERQKIIIRCECENIPLLV